MKKYNYTLLFILGLSCSAFTQQFTFHSKAPFGIQAFKAGALPATPTIQFYDYDGDGDLDVLYTGLDSIADVPNPGWEHLHFYFEKQENTGTRYAPQFGERSMVSDSFPYPEGYFFAAPGDLNFDGKTDFITTAHIDFIGNEKIRMLINTGPAGLEQFAITTLDSMGIIDFVPESFFMPHLVDLDLDGDLDLMTSGFNPAFTEDDGPDEAAIFYARNIGTKNEPDFQGWYTNPYGLRHDTLPEILTSGDIDLDGDIDFIGSLISIPADSVSPILVHLNTPGPDQKPAFDAILKSPFDLPSIFGNQQLRFPTLADVDGDGDLDLFVFKVSSTLNLLEYYVNNLCVVDTLELAFTICEGESLKYNGETYTEAGTFEFHFENSQHCDSIVWLTLTVEPLATSEVIATICDGDSYTVGGETFTQAGVYTVFVTGSNGCDSIINLDLTVEPSATSFIGATICEGESYSAGGNTFTATGDYTIVITAANGCDSIIQLSLIVDPIVSSSLEASICAGDSYTLGGDTFTEAGDYTVFFTSSNGCDSLVNLTLQVHEVNSEVTLTGETLTAALSGAAYQWIDCDSGQNIPGAVNQSYVATVTGNYAVIVTANGCSKQSECINVIITSTNGILDAASISLTPNPANGIVYISNQTGTPIKSVKIINNLGQVLLLPEVNDKMQIDISNIKPGAYFVWFSGDGLYGTKRLIVY